MASASDIPQADEQPAARPWPLLNLAVELIMNVLENLGCRGLISIALTYPRLKIIIHKSRTCTAFIIKKRLFCLRINSTKNNLTLEFTSSEVRNFRCSLTFWSGGSQHKMGLGLGWSGYAKKVAEMYDDEHSGEYDLTGLVHSSRMAATNMAKFLRVMSEKFVIKKFDLHVELEGNEYWPHLVQLFDEYNPDLGKCNYLTLTPGENNHLDLSEFFSHTIFSKGIDSLQFMGPGKGDNVNSDNFHNILRNTSIVTKNCYDIGLKDDNLAYLFSETLVLNIFSPSNSMDVSCSGFAKYIEHLRGQKQSKKNRSIMFGVTEGDSCFRLEQLLEEVPEACKAISKEKTRLGKAMMWNKFGDKWTFNNHYSHVQIDYEKI
ncbi:hypothetical protein WR25_08326 [Diploscapter pachys]|uniref:Uncharacterized protein n=1 Tax=Diploscapter pachys TaxID=2018661 RepID=A0A2A2JTL1_9BILA|nr:hypothetical protein WR25_08326 [Diploscapter pachys]